MKRLIKSIVVFCLIGIIGLGNTYASTEDCLSNDCLSALLKSDLLGANSDEVFKYFDDFPEQAFKSWKSMKDFPGVRIDLDHLQTLSKVSDRFTFANKTGYEGLTELFKIAKTSNVDTVLEGLKKADEIFDISLPVTIGAKKSGSQIFANVTDGDGNLVCRIVGGKLSKKQIIPDGTKVGKYDGLDIVQSGNRVGFLGEVNWATTGDLYKDAKLGAEIGGGAGANKKVFIIDDGNNDKVIALLREGKNVNVLNSEVEALQQLSSKGFPVVEIIEKTVHINPTTKIGTPAIVMKKYAKGSEQIVDVFGDEIKIIADADALKVVTDKSIDDLNAIKQMMIDKNVSIDDLQFLISSDGRFVIADPVGANFASAPSKVNLDLIDELINQVKKVVDNVGNTIDIPSDLLSKLGNNASKLDDWLIKYADDLGEDVAKLLEDMQVNLGTKNIDDVFEDAQGRLLFIGDSNTATRVVTTIERTATGKMKSFKYARAYNKAGQTGKPPMSANKLTPDFSGNPDWLYPITGNQKNIVKIKLTGKRNGVGGDFDLANKAAKLEGLIPSGKWKPDGYTWHHMDDFDPITGESTLQLVKTLDHQGSTPHVGSAAQWSNYYGIEYQ